MAGVRLVRVGRAVLLFALVLTTVVSGRAEAPKKWTFEILTPTTGRGAAYAIDYVIGMNLAAQLFGGRFAEKQYFAAKVGSEEPPKVKF